MGVQYLTVGVSGAERDVRVRVRAGVVAVRVEHAGVRRVVVVAAAVERPQ
ncbi:MAG: hypothetical protein IJL30_06765 [Clostridia bacterium]|nr:hypothetical protein [Clostridia bacterium]